MQLGVHEIDLCQHLFGPIRELSAQVSTAEPVRVLKDGRNPRTELEDTALATYRFEAGFMGSHEMSYTELAGCDHSNSKSILSGAAKSYDILDSTRYFRAMEASSGTVADSTYQRIKTDIIFGRLAPDQKLKLDALARSLRNERLDTSGDSQSAR